MPIIITLPGHALPVQSGRVLPALKGAAMIRNLVLLCASLIAGWFCFSVVSSIDMGDVVAYHKFQKHVGSEPLRAGDVVAFAPSTTQPRLICSMDVADGVLKESPVSNTYVNGMSASLPHFMAVVDWVAGLMGRSNGERDAIDSASAVHFVGRVSRFPDDGETPPMSRNCACAVALSLSRFEQVCTVERSLIETSLTEDSTGARRIARDRTVGVTVRNGNFFFPGLSEMACPGLLNAAEGAIPRSPGSCGQGTERTFDVALRQSLGVIRERDLMLPQ